MQQSWLLINSLFRDKNKLFLGDCLNGNCSCDVGWFMEECTSSLLQDYSRVIYFQLIFSKYTRHFNSGNSCS